MATDLSWSSCRRQCAPSIQSPQEQGLPSVKRCPRRLEPSKLPRAPVWSVRTGNPFLYSDDADFDIALKKAATRCCNTSWQQSHHLCMDVCFRSLLVEGNEINKVASIAKPRSRKPYTAVRASSQVSKKLHLKAFEVFIRILPSSNTPVLGICWLRRRPCRNNRQQGPHSSEGSRVESLAITTGIEACRMCPCCARYFD